MAAAVSNGTDSDDVLWWCDCPQCAVSTKHSAYKDMSFENASNLTGYRHAAHAMIYAIDDRILFDKYKITASIMVCQQLNYHYTCSL